MAGQEDRLKAAFSSLDTNGDGSLCFDEFMNLLRKGDDNFPEDKARALFRAADIDASGAINFNEFVDFVFGHKDVKQFGVPPSEDRDDITEAGAKAAVLNKSLVLRNRASNTVKESGGDWRQLTWKERLEAVSKAEACAEAEAPLVAAVPVKKVIPIEEKSQAELVDYSIHTYDLAFAGTDPAAMADLNSFRESLKTAGAPWDVVEIQRYLAKGTAGWVFLAKRRASGDIVAMKLMRLTQALSGAKEWYMSKVLRRIGAANVVFTDEAVRIIVRTEAPALVEETIRDAGPINFYLCLFQDFMNGGTLEAIAAAGRLTPRELFKALEDVAGTLAKMHANNVTHRDIKPENVLVRMESGAFAAAKLCDFGQAEITKSAASRADDIRRFGVMLFSLVTGEGWTQNRLLHQKHDCLVERLALAVKSAPEAVYRELPEVVQLILSGTMKMADVAALMTELKAEAS